ncbi:GNAT family N-acetyltransferase [uncultured Sulfitobacter sp.]|uniref:GNAT family N-acetyltransferase n=1 Tax=uncultured Sulfitobacter sp. TaxID=191468 RepID=UPI0026312E96|nr:GNAT family N-acetyltransferase [uncultured Sulfitobacter sp.]
MFEITTAQEATNAALSSAMADAFSDYAIPMQLDEATFAFMMQQRGLDRAASRIAVIDGEIAAIWLVSIRDTFGYLISSGTRPPFRSRGMARAMAVSCLEGLRAQGVTGFQTEVLRTNETAAGLYRSLGMTVARELDCYVLSDAVEAGAAAVEGVPWSRIAAQVPALRDWRPSWQNDDPSLAAIAEDVLCLAFFDDAGLAGYGAANPATATFYQVAVRKDLRRQGVGRALLSGMQSELSGRPLRFINIAQEDAGFRAFMRACGAQDIAGQHELAMEL